jgi:indolepyruvate ferredoxin oxidoreductase beta subunit
LVLSVEPLEVMRYWHALRPDGWVVTSVTPYVNIPDYPRIDDLLGELAAFPNMVLVDTGRLAKLAGNQRAQNMVCVGAASILLDFTPDQLLEHVTGLFARKGEKIVAVNRAAFAHGRAAGAFFRGLVDAGMAPLDALSLCGKLDPGTMDLPLAEPWARAMAGGPERLAGVLARDGDLGADEVASFA